MTRKNLTDWLDARQLSYVVHTSEDKRKQLQFTLMLATDVSDWCHAFGTQIDYSIYSHREERGWWINCPIPDYAVS